ncbi:thiol-disulfide oxidoreductase DCC family protein [Vulgatibacter incomptus]|uniref:Thiol-disulfide oxidoreductase n=1 Tax=Vulgatibacter incomptus TaxID=1391653 RepID=A0A0K1PIP3_9BACT|nr:DUF393 domain-containing protein [Vulgatibacter incomptus]AKU93261.1 hypothetical protein AKJ08_3648 [Vulgatibacter incomptus]
MLRSDQILIIFDGRCGACSAIAGGLRQVDWRRAMQFLPSQTPGLLEAAGVSQAQADASVLAVSTSGQVWFRGGAVAACMDELLPLGLPIFRLLYLVPGLHRLADALYRFAARHRDWLGERTPAVRDGEEVRRVDPETEFELRRRRLATRMPTALPSHVTLH